MPVFNCFADNVLFMIKLYKNTEGGSFPVAIQIKSGAKLKSLKCEEKENKRKVLLVVSLHFISSKHQTGK